MVSIAAASDSAVKELETGLGGFAFIPVGGQDTHKVFNTFILREGRRPEATKDGLDTYKGSLAEDEKNIVENLSLGDTEGCPDVDVKLSVGYKGMKNVTFEMKIVNVSSTSVRQEDKVGLRSLIERNYRSIAEADTAIRGILTQNNGIENGFSDVIFGIAHSQATGRVETFNLGAKGKQTGGGEVGGGGTGIHVGVSSEPKKSLERGPTEGIVALNFFALHLRRANAGSNEVARLSSVFSVSESKEDVLLDAFRRKKAGLKKLRQAQTRNRFARVFRRLGKGDGNVLDPPDPLPGDVANQQAADPLGAGGPPSAVAAAAVAAEAGDVAKQQAAAPPGAGGPLGQARQFALAAAAVDNPESAESDSDAYMSAVETNDDDDLHFEQLGYVNSRHILLEKEPKKAMAELVEQVRQGPTEYDGMIITQLAPVRYFDISGFLPIYYNPANSVDEDLKVPSYVLCYKAVHADHWCLRPVEHGGQHNKEVVTMYSKEWRVRESIVRVREEDEDLRAMLESVGFHILEEGQDGELEEPDGEGPFVIMGRHELTRFHELGTSLSGIEYCKGYVQMKGHNEKPLLLAGTVSQLDASTDDPPDRKKQKLGD